jgi:hypothetical protein
LSGTLSGVAPESGTSSTGFARRAVFFVAFMSCIGVLFLFVYASSVTAKAQKPDTRMFEKEHVRDCGKKKQAHPNNDSQVRYALKIDLVYQVDDGPQVKTILNQQTPTPQGWERYDGSIYSPECGYGWLTDLRGHGRDRGIQAVIILPDGRRNTLDEINRPELANFEGRHGENRPLVFRIDLPDGWYRVTCASVDPNTRKPLVDQRSFKCRAHDVVFAGAVYGAPTVVGGRHLIESSGIVEVTEGHLRIVVGDPAYGGWTWDYAGPWYSELKHWWNFEYNYAKGWHQRLTRTVDPGFHTLGLNSLEVERVAAPAKLTALVFRDFFNRDDSPDVNAGVTPANRWVYVKLRPVRVKLHPHLPNHTSPELYNTSVRFIGPKQGPSAGALLQQQSSPGAGIIRYSTRVSLFTGAGSQKHSGTQEAGIVLLADPSRPSEFNSTFLGVQFDSSRPETMGRLIYRVGNGDEGYRTKTEVPDTTLPFKITEGEFEIIVEHDVVKNVLRLIKINGADVTDRWSLQDRTQRISLGRFGIRSLIHNTNPHVSLQQFYWYYRVEALGPFAVKDSFAHPAADSARSERKQRH